MSIKLIATDIDGTILKYNGEFNTEVISCIKNLTKKGIKICLVTGRMHKSAKKIAEQLGLNTPIVSYQGAMVREITKDEKILYEKYIQNDKAKEIIAWVKKHNVHINLYMNDNLYVEQENEFTKKYANYQKIPFTVCNFSNLTLKKINKILLIDYKDANKITKITNELQKSYPELYVVKSTDYFCEVCHPEATKGNGVKCLQEYFKISKDETLTIGDHDNDIELIESGGISIAMGNATEIIKNKATYITDTVDNNGFVKAVENFMEM